MTALLKCHSRVCVWRYGWFFCGGFWLLHLTLEFVLVFVKSGISSYIWVWVIFLKNRTLHCIYFRLVFLYSGFLDSTGLLFYEWFCSKICSFCSSQHIQSLWLLNMSPLYNRKLDWEQVFLGLDAASINKNVSLAVYFAHVLPWK